ncbi:DUF6518 family protein [Streptomyces roseoverticillatus]|uniref:DUF6518 family protein n=1 Tax=Streptomyces roseoverticillatus TaxID=66429 RepID=A0ABV3IVM5_9ACTN
MRSSLSAVTLTLAGGVAVGILGPILESVSGHASHAASVTLVAGWVYALVAFVSGVLADSKKKAAIMGFVSLVVTVFAYYVTKAIQGDFRTPDFSHPSSGALVFAWGDFLSMLALWCVFALLLGPICALAGQCARTGPYRLPSQLLVPVVAIIETSMRLSTEADTQEALVGTTWSVTRGLAIAVILVLVCVAAAGTWRRRSTRVSR